MKKSKKLYINEAKRLRVRTFSIAKLEEKKLYREQ